MKFNKHIITTTLFALATLGLVVFGLYPQIGSLQELKTTLHEEKLALAQQRQQSSDLVTITREYQEIQENASRLDQGFVKKDTISILKFIEEIESLSTSLGLNEQLSVTPLPQSVEDATKTSTVQYSAVGSFTNMYRFLEALQQKPYYITITDISLQQAATTESYTLTFTGTVHWK